MPQLIRRNIIDFGKIDAKSSMVSRDAASKDLFMKAFTIPPTFDKSAFVSGDRYLVYGTKGSGKTALLRYMMEEEKQRGSATKFVVFSEDISAQDLNKIGSAIDVENVLTPEIGDRVDVKDMWKLFLIKALCDLMADNKDLCNDHPRTERLRKVVDEALAGPGVGVLDRISKVVKGGTLRFKTGFADIFEIEALLNLERSNGTSEIDYSRFADLVINSLCRSEFPLDVRYCLYIDELNLSMLQQKKHKKDSILIRDLVQAVGHLNRIFVEKGVPIFIYAAIRIEVAKAINVSRNEIDKYLIDHGQKTQWHSGFEVSQYPLFSIIEQRIVAIEKKATGRSSQPAQIWADYFAGDLFGVGAKQFLSEVTWCNPRDIVNIFNLASAAMPSRLKYDTEVFAAIAHAYSDRVWSERAEELNAEHSMTVVNTIKRLLSSYYQHFKIETLKKHAETVAQSDQVLRQVLNTVGIEKVCRDLYHVGIVGQSLAQTNGARSVDQSKSFIQTWFYRDNVEFDPSQWMIVHLALYPCLKLGSWRAERFAKDPRIAS
ncbi:hypothetical protein RJJ65_16980 [Rhizobium hidalgonense]|uniref:Uncharacterized protein n=1 Tax=Rhizobium hidalgonense TaxID=1538159 RepID=A0AAJ2GXK1_9HYPH|nr:hypothetical protein [Rhizobium hidalgonense]MDR9774328.1 hypothetical protein [Rhizobium hidalgonense]